MSLRQSLDSDDTGRFAEMTFAEVTQRRLRVEDVLRGLFIAGVLLVVGFLLGNFTFNEIQGRGTPYFVLALALGVLLTAAAYYKIEWALLAFVFIAWVQIGATPDVATGVSSGTGKGLGLTQVGMTFLLFIWALRSAARQQFSFVRLPLNAILVVFLAFNVLSCFNGIIFWDSAVARYYEGMGDRGGGRTPLLVNLFEIVLRLLSVGAFWLFANNLRDAVWVRRASWLLLLPGASTALCYLLGIHVPTNSYAVLLEVVVACTLFAWLLEPRAEGVPARRGLRALGWLALAVLIYQVFRLNLNWVSGWFGLFAGLYCVAFLRSKRLFAVLLVVGLLAYLAGHAFLQQTVVHKVDTSGDLQRFGMMHAALYYALRYPLGVGPGNYRSYNAYFGSPAMWNTSTFSSAHGYYSQMLSEMGFVGLFLTALFVLTGLVMVARFYQRLPVGPSRTFVLGIAGMWAGVCAACGIGDYLIPVYHNNGVYTMGTTIYGWIGLGIAVAQARLYGLVSDQKAAPAVAPPLPNAAEYYPRRLDRESS